MPELSRFFGIVVAMYYNDHEPPHFHAKYGGQSATFAVEDLRLLGGWLPPRALGLVSEWAAQHQAELRANWQRARNHEALLSIAPLE